MTITLRGTKGSALTYAEADANISELDKRTRLSWAQSGSDISVRESDPLAPQFQNIRDGIYAWGYPHDAISEAFLNFDVEYAYAVGTDLYVGVHWTVGESAETGTVRFGLEFTWAWSFGDTQPTNTTFGPSTTIYIHAAADGTPYKHYIKFNDYADKFPGSLVQGNMRFLARVFRDGTHVSDTFPDSAFILGVDLFYQVDKFGSLTKEPPFINE